MLAFKVGTVSDFFLDLKRMRFLPLATHQVVAVEPNQTLGSGLVPEVAANSAAVRTEGNSPCFDFDELRGISIYRSKHAKPRAIF